MDAILISKWLAIILVMLNGIQVDWKETGFTNKYRDSLALVVPLKKLVHISLMLYVFQIHNKYIYIPFFRKLELRTQNKSSRRRIPPKMTHLAHGIMKNQLVMYLLKLLLLKHQLLLNLMLLPRILVIKQMFLNLLVKQLLLQSLLVKQLLLLDLPKKPPLIIPKIQLLAKMILLKNMVMNLLLTLLLHLDVSRPLVCSSSDGSLLNCNKLSMYASNLIIMC